MERVGNAVAESKQDGSGQHRGKRATPPDGVGIGLQEKATNRRAEGQGACERQTVEREVAAEQMGWSHVRDQRPENENMCDFGACQDNRYAGEDSRRGELRVGEGRWQHREQGNRKKRGCQAKACPRRIRATRRTAGICAMTMKEVLTRMMIPISARPT